MDQTQIDNWYEGVESLAYKLRSNVNELCSFVIDGPKYIDVIKLNNSLKRYRREDQERNAILEKSISELEREKAELQSQVEILKKLV